MGYYLDIHTGGTAEGQISPEQAREWIDSGEVPELAAATRLQLVDLDSGHWPMFSAPQELAALLHAATSRSRGV